MSDRTETPKVTAGGGWDERNLRADIVSVWGEHGAHADVFDWMTARIEELEAIIREASQIITYGIANRIGEGLVREAAAALSVLNETAPTPEDGEQP